MANNSPRTGDGHTHQAKKGRGLRVPGRLRQIWYQDKVNQKIWTRPEVEPSTPELVATVVDLVRTETTIQLLPKIGYRPKSIVRLKYYN